MQFMPQLHRILRALLQDLGLVSVRPAPALAPPPPVEQAPRFGPCVGQLCDTTHQAGMQLVHGQAPLHHRHHSPAPLLRGQEPQRTPDLH